MYISQFKNIISIQQFILQILILSSLIYLIFIYHKSYFSYKSIYSGQYWLDWSHHHVVLVIQKMTVINITRECYYLFVRISKIIIPVRLFVMCSSPSNSNSCCNSRKSYCCLFPILIIIWNS
jgi:hypothetical protein